MLFRHVFKEQHVDDRQVRVVELVQSLTVVNRVALWPLNDVAEPLRRLDARMLEDAEEHRCKQVYRHGKGEQTREHIMATAEGIILRRGYAGTSIEEIIGQAGIAKGGFFYHFDGKKDLARCLIKRFLKNDIAEFTAIADRAHPGCLVAAFAYEAEQVVEKYPMKIEQPLEELTDMLSTIIEGGIVMTKVLNDRNVLPKQLLQYRNYIRVVFGDA